MRVRSALLQFAFVLAFAIQLNLPAAAHEVRPAIADVTIGAEAVHIDLRLALEALVGRVDMRGLTDTDNSPRAATYDALRKLAPSALETALRAAWPDLSSTFHISVDGQRLVPVLIEAAIPEVGNAALPRDSRIKLRASLADYAGKPVVFGWDAENGPLIVRQAGPKEGAYTGYLKDGQLSAPMRAEGTAAQGAGQTFLTYIVVGFEHIIPKGLDHILFVLGLFFFALRLRPLLIQITAFTFAHTITLALASLGVVTVPASVVEPLIAASIVYVGVENLFAQKIGIWRTALVFGFGLLHGLGFASVLGEVGLQTTQFVTGLIAFNVGVELGQIAVIIIAFFLIGLPFGKKPWYRNRIAIPCSLLIALVGAFWFYERMFT
ncbi:MAG: HupE/UreJ family protein [Pseudomonadota bacterium]